MEQPVNISMGLNGSINVTSNPTIISLVYYSEAVVQPTILAVGILTNLISIVVLAGSKIPINLRICIVSLTLSDLLATLSGFTQMLVEVVYYDGNLPFGYWESPAVASHVLYYFFIMFLSASASIVILLAIIRCSLVLRPVATRQFLDERRTKFLCFFTGLGVFILYLPIAVEVVWQSCYKDNVTPICVAVSSSKERLESFGNNYLYMLLVLFGPILVLVYIACFLAIHITLKRSKEIMATLTEPCRRNPSVSSSATVTSRRRMSITTRVTRTLLAILALDTLCTLPTVIQGVGLVVAPKSSVFDERNQYYDIFDVIAEIFLCFRPTYNFWLYAFTHKEFQLRGWEILWNMQNRCRCFLLGLIKVPTRDEENSSRTQSTYIGPGDGPPGSPTGKMLIRVAPLSQKDLHQVEKAVAAEKARNHRLSCESNCKDNITHI